MPTQNRRSEGSDGPRAARASSTANTVCIESINSALLDILKAHEDGLSEYDLLTKHLALTWEDDLQLFRCHFALFHCLHRLKNKLEDEKSYTIELSPLSIKLVPYEGSSEVPALPSPLEDYYLSLENLDETTADDVSKLLASFWQLYDRHSEREEALIVLGLPEDATALEVRNRYYELMKEHHPDKGGVHEKAISLNKAMTSLAK